MTSSTRIPYSQAVPATALWPLVQYALLCAGMALVATLLFKPALGLNLLWNGLIPLAPAILVIAPGLWRNICPMATFSLLPAQLGLAHQQPLTEANASVLSLVSLLALFTIIPLRHLSLNTSGPATALMLVLSALAAFLAGMKYSWRSGWCNTLCPIHPAERLYGQRPAITLPNARCGKCVHCATPCPDSTRPMTPLAAPRHSLQALLGHAMTGAFAGFIWGWFHVPDFFGGVGWKDILTAYAWPFGGAIASLSIYGMAYRWLARTPARRSLLSRAFAVAAAGAYYWYRIPALTGFGLHAGNDMLVDLSGTWPALPWVSRVLTTTFLMWFLLLRDTRASWLSRPAGK